MTETRVVPLWVQNVLDTPVVRLNLWSIKFNASNIQLEGFVKNEERTMMQKVVSEMICKRMTSNLLLDVSGRFFELSGQIDREFQLKTGMPKNVIDEFSTGFPENWAFLINQSLSNEQRSARREIEHAPASNANSVPQTAKGPIVTLADDTEIDPSAARKRNFNEIRSESNESQVSDRGRNAEDELEKVPELQEENNADYTFRAPQSQLGIITPIRWERGKGTANQKSMNVFEETPTRVTRNRSATSTPVAVTSSTRKSSTGAPLAFSTPLAPQPSQTAKAPAPPPQEDIFAVPRLPSKEKEQNNRDKMTVPSSPGGISLGMLANLENIFTAETPEAISRRQFKVPMRQTNEEYRRRDSPPRSYDDFHERVNSRDDDGRESDGSLRRSSSGEYGQSRICRKRGLVPYSPGEVSSDEEYFRERKRQQDEREKYRSRYYDQYEHADRSRYRDRSEYDDSRRKKNRTNSSSLSRSVRFEDDRYSERNDHGRYKSRNYDRYDDDRSNSRERSRYGFDNSRYSTNHNEKPAMKGRKGSKSRMNGSSFSDDDDETLRDIERREKELKMKLEKSKKMMNRNYEYDNFERKKNQSKSTMRSPPKSRSSDSFSEDDENRDLVDEWDRQNRDILDNSMVASGLGRTKKQTNGRKQADRSKNREKDEKELKEVEQPKVKKEKAKKQRKIIEKDAESISATRPRRACATPASAPTQKKVTWPRRDLDKLKRIIDMKKPTGHEEDWKEVTRLLAKEGVEFEDVKQIAVNRLKWRQSEEKEIVNNTTNEKNDKEEEEKKRRKGIVAAVREDIKLREEMMGGKRGKDSLGVAVDAVEEIAPADISADESFLGPKTPIGYTEAIRKKGGKRRTIVPEPVEDSPMGKSINSSLNKSPRTQAAKLKETETTMKYVQQLTTMQTRPGSRANKSYLLNTTNNTTRCGKKNTSMSVDEGAKKAMKMIKKGRQGEILEEEDEEESDTDDAMSEGDEENVSFVR